MEAGHAASHPEVEVLPIYAATSTSGEKNVIREELTTVACWRMDDARFAFGSAFVGPEAKAELAELKGVRDAYPDAPMAVFGHADPVGDEESNKRLSGQRAEAIYAVLVREPERWEKIYGADGWGLAQTQTMLLAVGHDPGNTSGQATAQSTQAIKDFQGANGLDDDGVAGPQTRAVLFAKYMEFLFPAKLEKSEFLGKGADAGGKADFQGCSEFNPAMVFSKAEYTAFESSADKTQRNEENSVNRRVLVFFFRPGTTAPADKWPCPKASEGTAGCRKRLWSDQAARRANSDERREFATDEDTFGCRFYHRLALGSPCEQPGSVTPAPKGNIVVTWKPAKAYCGQTVELIVETVVPGVTTVHVEFSVKNVAKNKGPDALDIPLTDGKGTTTWKVKNIGFKDGGTTHVEEEIKATATGGTAAGEGTLEVKALLNGDTETFDETRSWSGFTNHSHWDQKIEKFRNKVHVEFDVMKAWGGTRINLTGFVTGQAGGCPGNGHRWGRSTTMNTMQPDEYYDGTAWVPLPTGFTPGATNYFGRTFTKSGTSFVGRSGGTWPEAFADYDFNDAKYTKIRADWCDTAHKVWSDVFVIRRKSCPSEKKTNCCRYTVDVKMEFNEVTADGPDVVFMAPGSFRADAKNWAMDEPNPMVAAHEVGHHMDNPDEYVNGAVDTTMNGDGAVNGIDDDSIMGQNLTKVKVRHYHGFVEMTKRIIKTKYGMDYEYEAVDK
jgi:hypothetical protein